jgi:hypothetical protein
MTQWCFVNARSKKNINIYIYTLIGWRSVFVARIARRYISDILNLYSLKRSLATREFK